MISKAPLLTTETPALRSGIRLGGLLSGATAWVLFSLSIVAINVLQTASLVLLPVWPRGFRAVNRWFANTWWGAVCLWMTHLSRIETVFSGDSLPADENAIVLPNHQTMADIPALFQLGFRSGRLGDMKWFAKDILKYIPGVGWGMFFLDCVYLKRDWAADQSRIEATFRRLREHRVRFWLVTFVEGTRVRTHKLEKSREYARAHGLPALKHTLLPRTKGFTSSLQGLKGEVAAVYDVTVGYENGVPSLWEYMCGRSPRVHLHVRRFPVAALPKEEAALAGWLIERAAEKDERIGRFKELGRF